MDVLFLFSLRKESKLSVFKGRQLRTICASEWEEVAGGWNRLRNEEMADLHSSPNNFW